MVGKRPERTERPEFNAGAGFEADVYRTFLPEPIRERPVPRAVLRPARRAKLTDELIAGLKPEPKQYYVWDAKKTGLGVRVGSSGSVSFVLKLSLPGKRSVWLTLEANTLSDAVVEYHEQMVKFGKGEELSKPAVDTLWQDAVDKFEKEHLQTVKPSTAATYRSSLKLVRDAFKNRPVRAITYEDVWSFHKGLGDKRRQANVCVQLCKVIFKRCRSVWNILPREYVNPVDALAEVGWKPYQEDPRDVRLSDDHLQQIGAALAKMEESGKESRFPIAAVRLLFFTGLRLRNVLDLQWDQVDLVERELVFKNHKTSGQVGTLRTPLNDAALEVLQGLPRISYVNKDGKELDHPFVLPGDEPGKPIRDIGKFWKRMVKLAGLEQIQNESGEATNLHRHDLRHAHGNAAADLDMNLQAVAALLGHKDAHTSARYSKRGVKKAQADSQKVSGSLKAKMGGK
jgi:integrase